MDHPAHTPMDQPQSFLTDRVVTGWFQKETTILPPPPLQKAREEEKKNYCREFNQSGERVCFAFYLLAELVRRSRRRCTPTTWGA